MTRPVLRVTQGPSALGVTMDYDEAQRIANFLAAVTGLRMRVSPHPLPMLGWVVDHAGERPGRARGRTGQARHLGVVR